MDNLRRWKALSIRERTIIINERFGCPLHSEDKQRNCDRCKKSIHIQPNCLRKWYVRNGIKYVVAPYRIAGSQTEEQMLRM